MIENEKIEIFKSYKHAFMPKDIKESMNAMMKGLGGWKRAKWTK